MRQIHIKREKRFVGCAATLKIYVEDSQHGDLKLHGKSCRKVGDLKNGRETVLEMDEQEHRIFVIGDKLSGDFCCDMVVIPAGTEDVYLTGRNQFNLTNGNAFRFRGVTDPETLALRKKRSRKSQLVFLSLLLIGFLFGIFLTKGLNTVASNRDKTFTVNGISVTVNSGFSQKQDERFDLHLESANMAVLALKEPFSLAEGFGDLTLEEYFACVHEANGMEDSVIMQMRLGIPSFLYNAVVEDINYRYTAYMFKTEDAFWLVQFVVREKDAASLEDKMDQYAAAISFAK